jgi:hypothetical protein
MGLIKPDPDGSVGTWDTELNQTIDIADSHDHTPGNGVLVPVAGLDIDADLAMATFAITQIKAAALAAVLTTQVTGYVRCLFTNSADNELYWRTSGGVNVQLTSGASLNAALLGGITGAGYGTAGVELNYVSGSTLYNFLRAANHRAFIDSSDIRLFQSTAGITNAVKLRSPNALAASYDWIFPAALPASTQLLQLSSTGQVVASNSGLNSVALTSGEHVTVAGTGLYKRGTRVRPINPSIGSGANGTTVTINDTGAAVQLNEVFLVPLAVNEGERITQVSGRILPDGAGDIIRMRVYRVDASGSGIPARTQLGATQTSVSGTTSQTLTVSGLTEAIGTSLFTYHVEFVTTAVVVNAVNVTGVFLTTDVP